jgi:hypothetical protein
MQFKWHEPADGWLTIIPETPEEGAQLQRDFGWIQPGEPYGNLDQKPLRAVVRTYCTAPKEKESCRLNQLSSSSSLTDFNAWR